MRIANYHIIIANFMANHVYSEISEIYRLRFIFLPMFNIFCPILDNTSLCVDYTVYPLEKCKFTVILFGFMLLNLKGH